MKINLLIVLCCCAVSATARQVKVEFVPDTEQKSVKVLVDNKHFTSFIYPDNLEKPVLYPIYTAGGLVVTRGFPLKSRDGERTDHPHHVGLWLNYESVNGLDFWNNSYNIPAANKVRYGWVRNTKVEKLTGGKNEGRLSYTSNWENQAGKVLLKEQTTFVFSGRGHSRSIDRITTLIAQQDTVFFKDVKDGMIGLRVTKELEMPSDKVEEFTDSQGNITRVPASNNGANGNYLSSAGKQGNDVWGSRGNWCMLYAKKEGMPVAVSIIDHPKNPGYPTYWHARDYGLFAANPLGQSIFSNGKERLNMKLAPGQSVTFKYRVQIDEKIHPDAKALNAAADDFAKTY
ncbi:PmoA family protein [Pedobacter faecalis]|uniref:DUF6807 domain-containing protein n=1 Tax=Pedobacter faecalis TaxID=3041495 RepID=UPI00254F45C7|nr:PmoA family protein [Pedobacter sp. ELA7]